MPADPRSLDFVCMDCGKRPSHYFPSGSFGLAQASFLCVPCAEERVAAINYEMHVREAACERAQMLLNEAHRARGVATFPDPPAPPLLSGTLCSGKPPLPDVVVGGREDRTEKV
jgi:hypothetical protein